MCSCFYAVVIDLPFCRLSECLAFWSFPMLNIVHAKSWLAAGLSFSRAGFRQRDAWLLLRSARLVAVIATELLKMVPEKTDLKEKAESKSDSCTGGLGQSEETIPVGSLGGFSGGFGSHLSLSIPQDCCWLALSSWLRSFSEHWTDGSSSLTVTLQLLFKLARLDDPSAVEMTLLARCKVLGDLGRFALHSFARGVEKQLRQPDADDDLPWTQSTVTGDKSVALLFPDSTLLELKLELRSGFSLPVSHESEEQRVIFALDPLRMLLVPRVSQKSCDSMVSFCFGADAVWTLETDRTSSFCWWCCLSECCGVEESLGGWQKDAEERNGGCCTGLLPLDQGSFSRLRLNSPLLSLWARLWMPLSPGKREIQLQHCVQKWPIGGNTVPLKQLLALAVMAKIIWNKVNLVDLF